MTTDDMTTGDVTTGGSEAMAENTDSGTDIAIVGMSGRFPGAADVAGLWAEISAGRSGITRFTDAELRAAGVSEEQLADPAYVKAGAVITGIEDFDAGFFGFGPKEAQLLDPQHRIYLELNWHALEDAGCDPSRFDGTIGVFGGTAFSSYLQNNLVPSGVAAVLGDFTVGLANDKDSLATRVAHALGLTGPAYGVQSYCSTSLVAVCAAASSLANFECDFALAGGVAVSVPHRVGYQFQPGGIAPPDGECRAFDAVGQGSPTGSGAGVVALRRLQDALADGDRVYAVIRGWAVNNDGGRKAGFTAPSVQGQAAVIAEALSSAGLAPSDIDYIEAHGTGTALGDAVEIAALQHVFKGEACLIGSVKTNVGHLDRAAGVTGLIKAALALHHAEIPPTRNLTDPNRQLRVGEARLEVVTTATPWPRRAQRVRRGGVSAFGIGGTNAHVVLEEAPVFPRAEPVPRHEVLLWSARSAGAADALTAQLAGQLAEASAADALCDVAYTLQAGRRVFEHRRMLVAASRAEAVTGMRDAKPLAQREPRTDREVAFLIGGANEGADGHYHPGTQYPGTQYPGTQPPGAVADLYRAEPVFAAALDECRTVMTRLPGLRAGTDPLAELIAAPDAAGAQSSTVQSSTVQSSTVQSTPAQSGERRPDPATAFALRYALARLVMSWGIRPALVAGYGLGEYVAACLSGVLTLDSAVRLAVHAAGSRGKTPTRTELTAWIAASIPLAAPDLPYVSSVTGAVVTASQATSPEHWAEHACSPVRFDAVLATMLEREDLALLEVGEGDALAAMARGRAYCPPERGRLVVSSLPGPDDPRAATEALAEAAGKLWLAGVPVDWDAYQGDRPVAKVQLPGYPFQRQRYWIDPPAPVTAPPAPPATHEAPQPAASVPPARATPAPGTPAPGITAPGITAKDAPAEARVRLMRQSWTQAPLSAESAPPARCVLLGGPEAVSAALAGQLRNAGVAAIIVPPAPDNPSTNATTTGGTTTGGTPAAGSTAAGSAAGSVVTDSATSSVQALSALIAAQRSDLVIDLRALGTAAAAGDTGPAGDTAGHHAAADDGRGVVLPFAALADALGSDGTSTTRVLLVTAGGQAVLDDDQPLPGAAAAGILSVVANQEYLNLECRTVDLDPRSAPAESAAALAAECRGGHRDVLVAYRHGQRHIREFEPAEPATGHSGLASPESVAPGSTGHRSAAHEQAGSRPAATATPIRPGGTYLITGGLGNVGLQVAEHLARSGAARLILTSRTGLPASKDAARREDPRLAGIERLRRLGADVRTPAADVTDAAAMRAALAEATADGGRLDGVIHAAADARQETFFPLRYLTQDAVSTHFAAKVTGALVLRQLIAELPASQAPDFCLLFSSTSAVLGGLAFGSYAAANAALSAIAIQSATAAQPPAATQSLSTPGGTPAAASAEPRTRWIAASWDTWAGTLDKIDGGVGATMAAHAMTAEEALAAFDRLLSASEHGSGEHGSGEHQPGGRRTGERGTAEPAPLVVAAGLDDRLPRVSFAPDSGAEPAVPAEAFPRPDLPEPYAPALTATQRAVAAVWSSVLGVSPVGIRDNFFDLGGNSLVGLQMLTLLKKRFGITLPAVTLFEAPNVLALAEILDDKSAATAPPHALTTAPAPAAAPRPGVLASPRSAPATLRTAKAGTAAPGHPAAEVVQDTDRRIAIVGMAGRFPGAANVDEFWRNLRDGVESVSFFTPEELLASGEAPELISNPAYVPARPVLDDVSGFDAAFFGLSARTAALTDPQQRIFLEVCWEALEHAGYAAPEHRARVGVYGGCNISTYLFRMPEEVFTGGEVSTYEIIMGNDKDALTTTASYLFNLHGPSVAVQTFCSTSLVATHLAINSLRAGDCELALAGGVSVRVPDRVGHLFQPGGMESPDGHVRTFDAQARGSMFGDGAAVVVLKRLADAVRDGDHVWAVIRGSAMNNDGAEKVGYTAPSVRGQARVIADAMADAGITSEDVSYIEAHGTATELGDPIEVAALTRAFGPAAGKQYCPIGSAKTNVGHLDRAAGVAGLIKTSLALTHEVIPPSLHYTAPNPDIDFADSPFYVNAELAPWRTRDGRRPLAGVNSLGMGGTNVHVVVEQAPPRPADHADTGQAGADAAADTGGLGYPARRYQVLPVSARSSAAADESCGRLGRHLGDDPGPRLADVAYTLQVGRKTFEHRRVLVAADTAGAAAALSGTDPGRGPLKRVDAARGRGTAFLFTGVGEQYPGLVRELYQREPAFRAALDECLAGLRPLLGDTDLAELLTGPRGAADGLAALLGRAPAQPAADPRAQALSRTEVVQAAMFAVEYALAATLIAWGIRPQLMLGYSLGEYVAACLAGVLSLPDALALVARRAQLIAELPGGSMIAVPLPADELRRRFPLDGLDVAAVNGPAATVLAGPPDAVAACARQLSDADIPSRELATTHAFHSRMLAPASDELTAWIKASITLSAPAVPYISNLTGEIADADLVCDPGYWARHMCETVQFAAGVRTLLADPELAVVEIGPGQSLGAMLRAAGYPPERWPQIVPSLPAAADRRPDDAVLAECVARLWLLGVEVDWDAHHGRNATTDGHGSDGGQASDGGWPRVPARPGRIPLPTYPFQRQRYWFEGRGRTLPSAVTAGAQPGSAPGGRVEQAPVPPDLDAPPAGRGQPSLATLDAIAGLPTLPERQWLYLPAWRQAPAQPAAAPPGSWLVYARDGLSGDVAAELADAVAPAGATVRVVRPGEAFAAGQDGYLIRPGSLEDTRAMLRDLKETGVPLERVVHLWALGTQTPATDSSPAPTSAEARALADGVHTLVGLARAAGELGLETWSLDVAVSGTQPVYPGEVTSPHGATLTGPCRVIPLEYPQVTARLIDLAADQGPDAARELVAELRRPQQDPTVALRRGRRWLPTYELMPAPDLTGHDDSAHDDSAHGASHDPGSLLRAGGVYLITGGLGGIGLAMAEKLAAGHQAKLVLLARHGLPERAAWPAILAQGEPPAGRTMTAAGPVNAQAAADRRTRDRVAKVTALLDLGAEVEIVTGDVSDPRDVRRACRVARQRFGALHGVLHVAGVPGLGLMQFKSADDLDREMSAKVAGTLALAEALRIGQPDEARLDFLALFSSVTSATGGGPGQVGYCAANAFLDAYAQRYAAPGRKVVSVNWGEWTWNAWDDGLSGYAGPLQEFFRANRAKIGIGFDAGWRSLLRVLATDEPRVVVSTQDFPTMVRHSAQFTVAAVTSRELAGTGGARHPRPELVTPYTEPAGPTEETIAGIWSESLHLEQVGAADSFFELGGNSLLGVGIVAAVRDAFGLVELPPHILYEAPTVASLAKVIDAATARQKTAGQHLAGQHLAGQAPADHGPANGMPAAEPDGQRDSRVRAQLRRSGLGASADRRRGQP